jgi:integrase
LILLGFSGAFRRSELVALKVQDITETREGLVVKLRRSKTDQEGHGQERGIPYGSHIDTCPVRAYKAWLEHSGITKGPIFHPINRHGQIRNQALRSESVARIVKEAAQKAGLDPTKFSGHSLRSGLATSAAEADVPEADIMAQGGWKSQKIARRYIRRGSLFKRNAASKVGL